ncbi:MAG TPA: MFS transporter [Candidatus Tectomicrobia bacterium]
MKASAPHRVFYGWVIVLVSFLTLLLVMGTRFSFGVFYTSMLEEMGWSRAATAGIFSVSMLVYAVVALGVGAAFDWLGPRRMFPLAALLLGAGFFLCSRMTTLWEFYLYYGVIVGTGFTALGFIPHVSLTARWFVRRRGLATSLALAGTGVGSLLFAPCSEYLIVRYGWQHSYLIYAVLIPGVAIPLILIFHRNSPEDMGLQPDGIPRLPTAEAPVGRLADATGATPYMAALKTRAFWVLSGIIFTVAFNHMMLIVHQNQYLVDSGFSQAFAAWMLGLSGILRSGGSIIWGYLSDRTTRETSFTISTLFGVVALACLLSVQASPAAWRVVLFVLLMGLGYGGTSIIYATSAADIFQGRHFGKILGVMEIGFGLGASLGSYTAGFIFDHFQTYRPSFYMVMGLMLASIAGIWIAAPRTAGIGTCQQGRVIPDSGVVDPISRATYHQRNCSPGRPD